MDIHRLRVVNFDRKVSEKSSASNKLKTQIQNKSKEYLNQDIKPLRLSRHKPFNKYKSRSEILKVHSKGKSHIRKSKSFDGLKRNLSISNYGCSDKIKRTLRLFDKKSQIITNTKRRSRTPKQKRQCNRNEDIIVLFAKEKSKLAKRSGIISGKKYIRNNKASYSSYDVFGFKKSYCNFPQYLCRSRCYVGNSKTQTKHIKNKKQRESKTQTVFSCVRQRDFNHTFKLVPSRKSRKSRSVINFCRCLLPKHYNLVDFPDYSKSKIGASNTVRLYQIDSWTNESGDFSRPCLDEQVSVTPSRLQVPTTCYGDAAVATSQCVCSKSDHPTNTNHIVRNCKTSTKRLQTAPQKITPWALLSKMVPCDVFSKKRQTPRKSVIKYILFGLIIAVWSPCIIAVIICWLLTYPLRPHYTVNNIEENEFQSCECKTQKKLSKLLGWGTRLMGKAIYSAKAMTSLIRNSQEKQCSSYNLEPCSTSQVIRQPNPKRRYNLFYADNRGWLLKPVSNREKSKRKHFNFFNKFYNMFCGCDASLGNVGNVLDASGNKIPKKKSSLKAKADCACHSRSIDKRVTIEDPRDKFNSQKLNGNAIQNVPHADQNVELKKSLHSKHKLSNKSNASGKLPQVKLFEPCPPYPFEYQQVPQKFCHHRYSDPCPPPQLPTDHLNSKHPLNKHQSSTPRIKCKSAHPTRSTRQPCCQITPKDPFQEDSNGVHLRQRTVRSRQQVPKRHRVTQEKQNQAREYKSCRGFDSRSVGFMKYNKTGKRRAKPNVPFKKKVQRCCKASYKKVGEMIYKADEEIWNEDIHCHDMYIHTLKGKPWFWVHRCCPSMYPCFLTWHRCSENTCRFFLYIISICIWCPIICWCYLCYELFCQCIK